MAKLPTPQELIASRPEFPSEPWLDIKPQFAPGSFCYPAKKETMELLHMPNPHDWDPAAEDWNLPENWEQILCDAFEERLQKHRSLKLFMDICVRCGACADKCHFFLGTNDPKNMPVLRAELLRSLYRRDYTKLGKILGKRAGARSWDKEVVKELFYYAYQCTECRRCSLFCPYGIDTAEITAIVRELLHEVGLGIHWIMDPVKNCSFTGNHLGIQPHSFVEIVEMLADDCETITGIRPKTPFNEKGHEILFITPSGDVFADPGIYTFMGYLMVSSMQLGATVDYSILLTNNYLELRSQIEDKKEAAIAAISRSCVSILTSGGVLTLVGYALYFVSSISAIGDMGHLIGRGAIFSMILVLGFLPLLLTLVDKQIFKDQQRFEARSERLQKRIEEERIKRSSRLPAGSEE